jgi:hypothetical protein
MACWFWSTLDFYLSEAWAKRALFYRQTIIKQWMAPIGSRHLLDRGTYWIAAPIGSRHLLDRDG